ncbi:MAG: hypothetical protein WB767_18215 [Nocardioides sp.]
MKAFALLLAGCGLLLSGCATVPLEKAGSTAQQTPEGASACTEVVAGIDAFNQGDFEGTVDHFEDAVPLAEAEAEVRGTTDAADLLEAVEYYAELAPEDYPAASMGSPEFARYKAITLGQCATDGPGPAPEPPGLNA